MRGKVLLWIVVYKRGRITPAYAGKSSREAIFFNPVLGSPPPMRGKASCAEISTNSNGITPAYAGKSLFGGM